MNSEVTLVPPPSSMSLAVKDQVRLVFKRNDPHHAVLLEDDVPRYFLATSDGMNKVTVRDTTQRMVADVNRRMFLNDVFSFGGGGFSKVVKVADVLRSAPSTSDG
ncbi:hypothetical protein AN958_10066 [Leucoagaricus sp. SymC.cos]|nr:hypothetical protein AN958_10066 [Leucoagaricus sp. SymC.cos]